MDYSQFLYMREELSLIAVLLLLFLADLFMSPDAHKNGGKARRYVSLCTDAHSG